MPRVQRGKVAAISMRWTRRVAAPCVCFVPWAALASCRPLPQQLLPVSAAGGGRRRCKQGAARPFQPQRGWLHTKKLAASLNDFFSFLRFEVAARRNVRATACFHADANAPVGSQRQHMPFTVTTFPVKMRLERSAGEFSDCIQRAKTLRWARGREGCSDSPLPTSGLHPPRNGPRATRP